MLANYWLLCSILSILAVHSALVSFFQTILTNRRPFQVEIGCWPGIRIPLDRHIPGNLNLGDTTTLPICESYGAYLHHATRGRVWGHWEEPMTFHLPAYQCALIGDSNNPLGHFMIENTILNCCWGPFCNPWFTGARRQLSSEPTRRQLSSLPNGEEFCQSNDMIRNGHACQQSSCCHWNTWEHGEPSFHGQGRCWSSIGTQTCHDVHTTVGMVECHDEPAWWYDSDGPYYSCDWYRQDSRRCEWYGDWYRNFGKTANEACCGCRHEFGNVRRKLEEIEGEDHVPKRGFLFTNEIASGFNVESSEMIAMEGVTSTSSQCQERSWWDYVSLEHPTLECSAGEAIGAFYKTSLPNQETWSVEKGYCCAIDASDECTWKEVDPSAELMTCDAGYVLSGFKMDDKGYLFSDVEEIKCCKQ